MLKNRVRLFLFSFLLILACKKENDRPQWKIQVVTPLMHATLGVNNFIADSLTVTDSSNAIHLVYEDSLYSKLFDLDSLFRIPDTILPTVLTYPFTSLVLAANTQFYSSNQNATLSISGAELREVIIKSGFLRIETRNHLQTRVHYIYTIPGATRNGNAFQFSTTMSAAPPGSVSTFTGLYDMSGYKIDLTGPAGNAVNTISYNVAARTDTGVASINVFLGDTMVNLEAGLVDMVPYYAKGYLGQKEISEDSSSSRFQFFNIIHSGHIRLEEVTLQMTIENFIGVDAQAFITRLQSINSPLNSYVNINSPSILNHAININRATESGNPLFPVIPSVTVVQFNNSNSNMRSLIENLPDQLNYGLRINVNPLGNISGSTDFIYSDYLVNARLKIDVPLSFAADHLELADTSAFIIGNKEDFDPLGLGTFTLIADNGFPFEAALQLILLDEHNLFLDSIPVPSLIAAANTDANFKVIEPKRTKIPIYVDEARKQRILKGNKISIHASFSTPLYPQYYRIYAGYKLDLKLVADVAYLIH